jgi:hypothetical protein
MENPSKFNATFEASGPGSLLVSVNKIEPGKPVYAEVKGIGVSANVQSSVMLSQGTHDCRRVKLGLQEAFRAAGKYELRGLLEAEEWSAAAVVEYYRAMAAEHTAGKRSV